MTQPKHPTLLDLVQCWNAAHPSEPPLRWDPPTEPYRIEVPDLNGDGHYIQLVGRVYFQHGHTTKHAKTEQSPSTPGPWRDAWGHSRLRDVGTQYMQVRRRPDGDVDIRQRKSLEGTWEKARMCPIDLWRGEGWFLRTSRQSIEQWNATHSIGDAVRYWVGSVGHECPIKGTIASKAELRGSSAVVQIKNVGYVRLAQIEPSL